MSDRPTDMRYSPESWQGSSPNGGDAGVGVALPYSLPLSLNRYRFSVTDTDTESRANFAQN